MIWVDYGILIIVVLSALISVMRGFVREALSLAAWVAAFWVAFTFHQHLAALFVDHIAAPSIRLISAFALLFVVTLVLCAILNNLVAKLVEKSGLSGTDRMLGVLFGIARGMVVVTILVLLAGLTPLPADPWWKESIFIVHFQSMAIWLRNFLPPDIAANFQYA